MMKKGYLQISFAWIFALIVGAVILFVAIYSSTKIIDFGGEVGNVQTSEQISNLLSPLETGFESGTSSSFSLRVDSRIFNKCDNSGDFGKQKISVSQKHLNKWQNTDIENTIENKYIFSESGIEGTKFYLFTKPLEFPFKVTDLIYMTSAGDKYCFKDAPEDIEIELRELKQDNLLVENCTGEEIEVCFSGSCDILVRDDYVKKNGEVMYFADIESLMYAAIFSDKDTYECQLKRVMQRVRVLSEIYDEKADLVKTSNCNSNLDLDGLANLAKSFEDSRNLDLIKDKSELIGTQNENAICKLW